MLLVTTVAAYGYTSGIYRDLKPRDILVGLHLQRLLAGKQQGDVCTLKDFELQWIHRTIYLREQEKHQIKQHEALHTVAMAMWAP